MPQRTFYLAAYDVRDPARLADAAYFSPSWTAFQADRGRDFSVIVDGVSV
ncbi:MAG: hypothetical protein RBR52_14495 [Thiomonas sp.]|nr:hypothetical protein [Thiomonas sp.]MDY0331684.1 hypothetical protein [Thiomonas sp.]